MWKMSRLRSNVWLRHCRREQSLPVPVHQHLVGVQHLDCCRQSRRLRAGHNPKVGVASPEETHGDLVHRLVVGLGRVGAQENHRRVEIPHVRTLVHLLHMEGSERVGDELHRTVNGGDRGVGQPENLGDLRFVGDAEVGDDALEFTLFGGRSVGDGPGTCFEPVE